MIKVKVKCFSQVRYALGTDELSLELEVGTTTVELEKLIREKSNGDLEGLSLRVAVNQKYIPEERVLAHDDEVAFIPPVQGG